MARTDVPITTLVRGALNAVPGTTVLSQTNGHVIAAGGLTTRLCIEIINTSNAGVVATIAAGVNPPAVRAGIGAIAGTVGASGAGAWFIVESSQVAQADGSIWVDTASGATGTIRAWRLPE